MPDNPEQIKKIVTPDLTRGAGLDLAMAAVGGLTTGAGAVLTQQALNALSKPKADKK